ncbi:hypothetical protein [Morganella morganii]|uniref:hypothetical protein n=1 Tax=Morganella morganii TaxID=582 RepID=UPI003EBC6C37
MTAPYNTEVQKTIHHVASELVALEFINQDAVRGITELRSCYQHVYGALLPGRTQRCHKAGFSGRKG